MAIVEKLLPFNNISVSIGCMSGSLTINAYHGEFQDLRVRLC